MISGHAWIQPNFKTALQDLKCSEILAGHITLRLDAIEFAQNALQFGNQPRDDLNSLSSSLVIFLHVESG